MTFTCPNGHASTADDYCDQCGIRLGQPHARSPTVGGDAAPEGPRPSLIPCAVCGEPVEAGERYCQNCGSEFADSGERPASADSHPSGSQWQLVAASDRSYFDRVEADNIEFPAHFVERTFRLTKERVAIGRASAGSPEEQAIDLSGAPTDNGISRRHALLVRQPQGDWTVIDCRSTNGTFLNNATDPISSEEPVPVVDGDQFHLGAWTTVTLRSVPRHSKVPLLPAGSSAVESRPR